MMISVVTLATCLLAVSGKSILDKKPNIIFMFGDDHGWQGVSWHDEKVISPHMEGLMKDGIELDNAYVQPQCTPSRYSYMTGRYPFHGGMQHGVIYPIQAECSPLDQDLIGKALKECGYDTHLVGKWHLGFCDEACTPLQRGFDTFFGFYQGMVHHYDHTFGFGSLMGHDFKNGTEIYDNTGIHETILELARAKEVIENHDGEAPFYLNMMWGAPHQPYVCDEEWAALYPDLEGEQQCYHAMISQLDDAIGKIVESLKTSGHYDNTIIVYMADNGGEAPIALNAPLRGAKGSLFEGGVKSASWVHSPLLKKKGYKADQLLHVADWFPTFVSLGGGSTEGKGLDGVDQSDFIINGGPSARTEIIHNIDIEEPQAQGHRAIRVGDMKLIKGYPGEVDGYDADLFKTWRHCHWDQPEYGAAMPDKREQPPTPNEEGLEKMMIKRAQTPRAQTPRAASYFPTAEEKKQEEECILGSENDVRLFNIKEDPEERNNLAAQMPELVQKLSDKMEEAAKTLVKVPSSHRFNLPSGHPKFFGGEWTPGWCNGIAQHNIPIEDAE